MYLDLGDPHRTAGLQVDDIGGVLTDRRCRLVIYELCQSEQLSVGELADRLYDFDQISTAGRTRRALGAALRERHLPVLDRANVVEYDSDTEMVSFKPTGKQAEHLRRLAIMHAKK